VKAESDLTSCDVQREFCLHFLRSKQSDSLKLNVIGERFDDKGRSGANSDRPALQRILGLIRAGAINAVVVHRLDRLSRKLADCASLLHQFKEHGVRLFIVAMPELGVSAHDTFMLNMLAAFAEFERDMIADRIRDTRVGLVAQGRRIAGVVPFGYSADVKTKQLVQIPCEAVIVLSLFELIADGVPPSAISLIASGKGWRTRSGRSWTARQVLDTVSNPVYLGCFRTASGTRAGVHEGIIDDDLFDRCAAAIAGRRTVVKGPRTRRSWSFLERKVRCARCGQLMGIRTATEGTVVRIYFRCRKAAEGAAPCTGTQVRAYEIEQLVWSVLREPSVAFPRPRGRPARAMVTLYSLGQFMPMLDPASERALVSSVVQEVVWNAETSGVQTLLKWDALTKAYRWPSDLAGAVLVRRKALR